MKQFIWIDKEEDEYNKSKEYIRQEFGKVENCCGVIVPMRGSVVEVLEPLQECHGYNAPNNFVPLGEYLIVYLRGDYASHWVYLENVKIGELKDFCAGYGNQCTIDWRGARKSPNFPSSQSDCNDRFGDVLEKYKNIF